MSMPALAEQFGLTPQQEIYVRVYVETGDTSRALRESGMSAAATYNPLRSKAVLAAVQQEVARALAADAAVSRTVARRLMLDEKVSDRVRADIAFRFLDRAGYVPPRSAPASKSGGRELNEMTVDELRDLASTLEGEIAGRAGRAKNVTPAPVIDADPVDELL